MAVFLYEFSSFFFHLSLIFNKLINNRNANIKQYVPGNSTVCCLAFQQVIQWLRNHSGIWNSKNILYLTFGLFTYSVQRRHWLPCLFRLAESEIFSTVSFIVSISLGFSIFLVKLRLGFGFYCYFHNSPQRVNVIHIGR